MQNIKALIIIAIETRTEEQTFESPFSAEGNPQYSQVQKEELLAFAASTTSRYTLRWPDLKTLQIYIPGHAFIAKHFRTREHAPITPKDGSSAGNLELFMHTIRQEVERFIRETGVTFHSPDEGVGLFTIAHGLAGQGINPRIHGSIANTIFDATCSRLKYFYIVQCYFASRLDSQMFAEKKDPLPKAYFELMLENSLRPDVQKGVTVQAWDQGITIFPDAPHRRVASESHRGGRPIFSTKKAKQVWHARAQRVIPGEEYDSGTDDDEIEVKSEGMVRLQRATKYLVIIPVDLGGKKALKYRFDAIQTRPPMLHTGDFFRFNVMASADDTPHPALESFFARIEGAGPTAGPAQPSAALPSPLPPQPSLSGAAGAPPSMIPPPPQPSTDASLAGALTGIAGICVTCGKSGGELRQCDRCKKPVCRGFDPASGLYNNNCCKIIEGFTRRQPMLRICRRCSRATDHVLDPNSGRATQPDRGHLSHSTRPPAPAPANPDECHICHRKRGFGMEPCIKCGNLTCGIHKSCGTQLEGCQVICVRCR